MPKNSMVTSTPTSYHHVQLEAHNNNNNSFQTFTTSKISHATILEKNNDIHAHKKNMTFPCTRIRTIAKEVSH
jgi:predicted DNA-binding transcriptional regulator YafY